MNNKTLRSYGLIAALLCLAVLLQSADHLDRAPRRVMVPLGANANSVQSFLVANKVLKPLSGFALIARLTGSAKKIQAGEYSLSPAEPLILILWKLRTGRIVPAVTARATFPEGMSIYKMGAMLKELGFRDWEKFQGLVKEGITADQRQRHWGLFKYMPTESLEGYLFPDTYDLYSRSSAEAIAEVMIKRFEKVVLPFWDKAGRETKLTLHEIVTLASIIEKEAQKPKERPIIASVFYNRLKAGMPLAADPTIKYILERPTKRVYLNQLNIDSPYNTYKNRGLPPGPICNPGIESIKAAVYPAKTNYYFFVANKDGSHTFSATWAEHQRARAKTTIPTQ